MRPTGRALVAATGSAFGTGIGDVEQRALGATSSELASFGEDGSGELFVLSQDQGLFRVTPR